MVIRGHGLPNCSSREVGLARYLLHGRSWESWETDDDVAGQAIAGNMLAGLQQGGTGDGLCWRQLHGRSPRCSQHGRQRRHRRVGYVILGYRLSVLGLGRELTGRGFCAVLCWPKALGRFRGQIRRRYRKCRVTNLVLPWRCLGPEKVLAPWPICSSASLDGPIRQTTALAQANQYLGTRRQRHIAPAGSSWKKLVERRMRHCLSEQHIALSTGGQHGNRQCGTSESAGLSRVFSNWPRNAYIHT
ncbi:hypothetical protein F5B21DRAFT_454996 [Xylaria acuta]|nr:hypothetical protein F5B21DRAFT_454996 [Xylaria acuta]